MATDLEEKEKNAVFAITATHLSDSNLKNWISK